MADQLMPESFNEALIECVKAAGGSKRVGAALFPEKAPDVAQRHLLNCLQAGRSERLSPDHVLMVLRLARQAGCHVGMSFLSHWLGYAEPQPVEPVDQLAQLQREFIEATGVLSRLAGQINAMQIPGSPALKVVG